jgi:hypothetical protein
MKTLVQIITVSVIIAALSGGASISAAQTLQRDTVSMSPGYANEVYYSMPNRVVLESPRTGWDIAFRTSPWSSSILTNDGTGIVLWSYPKADTNGWAAIDTSGLSTWTPMYNDPNDWENGAFSRNALGHPDYGWGIYNSQTHDVVGDSLFIIKLNDITYKKFRIIKKHSVANIYTLRWADLDGSNEVTYDLSLGSYTDYDFTGFSLSTSSIVEFQPPLAQWDILFTKYMSVQPDGTPYPVTGVLSNPDIKTKRFASVPLTYSDWWVSEWDSTRSTIGWNWKVFNGSSYDIVDSLVFFVLSQDNNIYKLVFTKFEGGSTGNIMFDRGKVSSLGIGNNGKAMTMTAYPNPATTDLHLYFSATSQGQADIRLTDITGKTVRTFRTDTRSGELSEAVMDVTGLNPGIYMAVITAGGERAVQKIVVSR